MAAFNTAAYIDEAIRSVLAQRGVDWDLWIGDDASTDGTWDRIRSYRNNPRVHLRRFKRRQDAPAVRNRLVSGSRGKYLSVCDSDDRLLPGTLRALSRALDRNSEVGVAFGRLQWIDETGKLIPEQLCFPGPDRACDLIQNVVPHPGTLIRRSMYQRVGGYRRWAVSEDYDLFLRLAEVTRFKILRRATVQWRRRGSSKSWSTPFRAAEKIRSEIRRDALRRRYGDQNARRFLSLLETI